MKKDDKQRWVVFALACVNVALIASCSKPPVAQIPSSYVTFQASDNAFSCAAPANWTNTGFAQMGTDSGANFVSGPAKINITSSMIGSILGDMSTMNANQQANLASQLGVAAPAAKPPIEVTHEQFEGAMVHEHPDYSEEPSQTVESPYGEGRISEFTCDSGKTHGYRATFLGKNRSIEIVCQCPAEDWTEMELPFQHIVESVTLGPGDS